MRTRRTPRRKTRPRWPSMRTAVVRAGDGCPEARVDASVSLSTGRPVVDLQFDGMDEWTLTPGVARRIAVALLRAADCCDAKTRVARQMGVTVVRAEARS